jgi:hypothetical protein
LFTGPATGFCCKISNLEYHTKRFVKGFVYTFPQKKLSTIAFRATRYDPMETAMQINRIPPAMLQAIGSKLKPVERPQPAVRTPPVLRERYSEDPAVAAAMAEMNAYAGLGKNRQRI